MLSTLNIKALFAATAATLLLIVAIVVGSRSLENFDSALVAYLFGAIFAWFGVVYRYAVWLQRPPTWRYFVRGWKLLLTRRFAQYSFTLARHLLVEFMGQRFIRKRSRAGGIGHMMMAGGCMLAFALTFPLVFGWVHFQLQPGGIDTYEIYNFGFKVAEFRLHTWTAELIFNGLNWSAFLVVAGVLILMRRRLTHAGQVAVQTFEGDWMPLLTLLAVSVTGLGITLDYRFMEGRAHQFMAIIHATTVILFLLWIPFGKFFHILQRPAQFGIAVYRHAGELGEQAICAHTGEAFTSKMHLDDVKLVTHELGFDYSKKDGGSHLDLSPQGKRAALATAHLKARRESGRLFG